MANDGDSALSSVTANTNFSNDEPRPSASTRRSQRNPVPQTLYPGQIVYGSGPISKATDTQVKSRGS